jgi:hypothetical protein
MRRFVINEDEAEDIVELLDFAGIESDLEQNLYEKLINFLQGPTPSKATYERLLAGNQKSFRSSESYRSK